MSDHATSDYFNRVIGLIEDIVISDEFQVYIFAYAYALTLISQIRLSHLELAAELHGEILQRVRKFR